MVEMRSNSRMTGATSEDSVISIAGKSRMIHSPTVRSCWPEAYECNRQTAIELHAIAHQSGDG